MAAVEVVVGIWVRYVVLDLVIVVQVNFVLYNYVVLFVLV